MRKNASVTLKKRGGRRTSRFGKQRPGRTQRDKNDFGGRLSMRTEWPRLSMCWAGVTSCKDQSRILNRFDALVPCSLDINGLMSLEGKCFSRRKTLKRKLVRTSSLKWPSFLIASFSPANRSNTTNFF